MANYKRMEIFIDFMEKHPENTDAYIVKCDTIENVLDYIA